jgi:hypothetical protein
VSAAIEHNGILAAGDSVFVDPNEAPPDHLRGIQGIVLAVEGTEAHLRQQPSDEILRVEVGLLRRDRRRTRVRVNWEARDKRGEVV